MIKFKILRFKHYRAAQEINKRIDAQEATDEDVLRFAVSLIEDWDFVDAETGDPLPVGELDELSLEQCAEINLMFARRMGVTAEIPKESGEPSPSTSTR
jgi:hypothetical protein